jgi:TonB family protein
MADASALNPNIAREFQKSFFQEWDKQFVTILFLSLFVEAVFVFIIASRPVDVDSEQGMSRIQERYVNFVLKEELIKEESASKIGPVSEIGEETVEKGTAAGDAESEKEKGGKGRGGGTGTGEYAGEGSGRGTAGGREAARVAATEARRISREQISREVSNKGLLGLITGTGSAAQGEAVSDFFVDIGGRGGEGSNDLDQVLSNVDGLEIRGSSGTGEGGGGGRGGQGARGTRSNKNASIDDLVSDLGSVGSGQLSRSGELTVETPSEVGGMGRKSIYRSPDAIHEVLLSHVPAIRYCYERELKRDPELKGKIVVRITIAADGSVSGAEIVSSTLNSERVERCILARIRLWKDFQAIDPKEGDVTFRQVYTFGY